MPPIFILLAEKDEPLVIDNANSVTSESIVKVFNEYLGFEAYEKQPLLYYRWKDTIQILSSQEQLDALIKEKNPLYLYGTKELAEKNTLTPKNAFDRLGQLVKARKKIISCNHELARCVGILASAIALDTDNKDFDKEFKALEKVTESRKDDNSSHENSQDIETLHHAFGQPSTRGKRGGVIPGFGERHRRPHHHHHHFENDNIRPIRGRGRHAHPSERGGHHHIPHHRHSKTSPSEETSQQDMKDITSKIKHTHIQD